MRSSSDDDVVTRAKDGDQDAWRALYTAHASRLLVWLRSTSSGDAAVDNDDIAAAAWMTAARRVADFTGTTSDFGGWLFVIARNIAVNTRTRSIRRATTPDDGSAIDARTAQPDWSSGVDASEWARSLLKLLPRRQAEVIACIDIVGFDVPTTAVILDINDTAVRVARHRGLRRLRAELTAAMTTGPGRARWLGPATQLE